MSKRRYARIAHIMLIQCSNFSYPRPPDGFVPTTSKTTDPEYWVAYIATLPWIALAGLVSSSTRVTSRWLSYVLLVLGCILHLWCLLNSVYLNLQLCYSKSTIFFGTTGYWKKDKQIIHSSIESVESSK